jgi:O-methyltransferase
MEGSSVSAEELYLELLKKCLTRSIAPEALRPAGPPRGRVAAVAYRGIQAVLTRAGLELARRGSVDADRRADGRDWAFDAETMIGHRRLDNLQQCVESVLADKIPGDLIEAGVWRGGSAILMRAILAAHQVRDRMVWVADSFQGLPRPEADRYPADAGDRHWELRHLAVSLETVKANFERYGLLDDRVRFLPGWFIHTLPQAPIERLAVLRLDADMYGSTIEALDSLYPKLAPGGYAIIDDYGAVPGCRAAVEDYRASHGVTEPLNRIDWTGVFWRKEAQVPARGAELARASVPREPPTGDPLLDTSRSD